MAFDVCIEFSISYQGEMTVYINFSHHITICTDKAREYPTFVIECRDHYFFQTNVWSAFWKTVREPYCFSRSFHLKNFLHNKLDKNIILFRVVWFAANIKWTVIKKECWIRTERCWNDVKLKIKQLLTLKFFEILLKNIYLDT